MPKMADFDSDVANKQSSRCEEKDASFFPAADVELSLESTEEIMADKIENTGFQGLTFIICVKRDVTSNSESDEYHCVICSYARVAIQDMKLHLESRAHLLNVMRVENYGLYKECRTKSEIQFFKAILLNESSHLLEAEENLKKVCVASEETFLQEREKMSLSIKRILERHASGEESEDKFVASSLEYDKNMSMTSVAIITDKIKKCLNSLDSEKWLYEDQLKKIAKLHVGRKQSNIVIVCDERDNFDISSDGFDSRVELLKIPGMKFIQSFQLIETHPKFGKGTIFVFTCGINNLFHAVPLPECLLFKCNPPQTKLVVFHCNKYSLLDKALQVNMGILRMTKSDIAIFSGLVPMKFVQYNKVLLKNRPCLKQHHVNPAPPIDPIVYNSYLNTIKCYNDFTKFHAQALGFEPWDLHAHTDLKDFILLPNGYKICASEEFRRANKVKLLCTNLLSNSSDVPKTYIETNENLEQVSREVSEDPENHCSNNEEITPIESNLQEELLNCCESFKYDRVAIIADRRYMTFLETFKESKVLIFADQELDVEELEAYIVNKQKHLTSKTMYLLITGLHFITKSYHLGHCLNAGCRSQLQVLRPVYESKEELKTIFMDKLFKVLKSIESSLPLDSNIAILPALPVSLFPIDIEHLIIHQKKTLYPEYLIADKKEIFDLYNSWMTLISEISLSSLSKCYIEKSVIKKIYNNFQNLEIMDDEPNIDQWKTGLSDIICAILPNTEKFNISDSSLENCEKRNYAKADTFTHNDDEESSGSKLLSIDDEVLIVKPKKEVGGVDIINTSNSLSFSEICLNNLPDVHKTLIELTDIKRESNGYNCEKSLNNEEIFNIRDSNYDQTRIDFDISIIKNDDDRSNFSDCKYEEFITLPEIAITDSVSLDMDECVESLKFANENYSDVKRGISSSENSNFPTLDELFCHEATSYTDDVNNPLIDISCDDSEWDANSQNNKLTKSTEFNCLPFTENFKKRCAKGESVNVISEVDDINELSRSNLISNSSTNSGTNTKMYVTNFVCNDSASMSTSPIHSLNCNDNKSSLSLPNLTSCKNLDFCETTISNSISNLGTQNLSEDLDCVENIDGVCDTDIYAQLQLLHDKAFENERSIFQSNGNSMEKINRSMDRNFFKLQNLKKTESSHHDNLEDDLQCVPLHETNINVISHNSNNDNVNEVLNSLNTSDEHDKNDVINLGYNSNITVSKKSLTISSNENKKMHSMPNLSSCTNLKIDETVKVSSTNMTTQNLAKVSDFVANLNGEDVCDTDIYTELQILHKQAQEKFNALDLNSDRCLNENGLFINCETTNEKNSNLKLYPLQINLKTLQDKNKEKDFVNLFKLQKLKPRQIMELKKKKETKQNKKIKQKKKTKETKQMKDTMPNITNSLIKNYNWFNEEINLGESSLQNTLCSATLKEPSVVGCTPVASDTSQKVNLASLTSNQSSDENLNVSMSEELCTLEAIISVENSAMDCNKIFKLQKLPLETKLLHNNETLQIKKSDILLKNNVGYDQIRHSNVSRKSLPLINTKDVKLKKKRSHSLCSKNDSPSHSKIKEKKLQTNNFYKHSNNLIKPNSLPSLDVNKLGSYVLDNVKTRNILKNTNNELKVNDALNNNTGEKKLSGALDPPAPIANSQLKKTTYGDYHNFTQCFMDSFLKKPCDTTSNKSQFLAKKEKLKSCEDLIKSLSVNVAKDCKNSLKRKCDSESVGKLQKSCPKSRMKIGKQQKLRLKSSLKIKLAKDNNFNYKKFGTDTATVKELPCIHPHNEKLFQSKGKASMKSSKENIVVGNKNTETLNSAKQKLHIHSEIRTFQSIKFLKKLKSHNHSLENSSETFKNSKQKSQCLMGVSNVSAPPVVEDNKNAGGINLGFDSRLMKSETQHKKVNCDRSREILDNAILSSTNSEQDAESSGYKRDKQRVAITSAGEKNVTHCQPFKKFKGSKSLHTVIDDGVITQCQLPKALKKPKSITNTIDGNTFKDKASSEWDDNSMKNLNNLNSLVQKSVSRIKIIESSQKCQLHKALKKPKSITNTIDGNTFKDKASSEWDDNSMKNFNNLNSLVQESVSQTKIIESSQKCQLHKALKKPKSITNTIDGNTFKDKASSEWDDNSMKNLNNLNSLVQESVSQTKIIESSQKCQLHKALKKPKSITNTIDGNTFKDKASSEFDDNSMKNLNNLNSPLQESVSQTKIIESSQKCQLHKALKKPKSITNTIDGNTFKDKASSEWDDNSMKNLNNLNSLVQESVSQTKIIESSQKCQLHKALKKPKSITNTIDGNTFKDKASSEWDDNSMKNLNDLNSLVQESVSQTKIIESSQKCQLHKALKKPKSITNTIDGNTFKDKASSEWDDNSMKNLNNLNSLVQESVSQTKIIESSQKCQLHKALKKPKSITNTIDGNTFKDKASSEWDDNSVKNLNNLNSLVQKSVSRIKIIESSQKCQLHKALKKPKSITNTIDGNTFKDKASSEWDDNSMKKNNLNSLVQESVSQTKIIESSQKCQLRNALRKSKPLTNTVGTTCEDKSSVDQTDNTGRLKNKMLGNSGLTEQGSISQIKINENSKKFLLRKNLKNSKSSISKKIESSISKGNIFAEQNDTLLKNKMLDKLNSTVHDSISRNKKLENGHKYQLGKNLNEVKSLTRQRESALRNKTLEKGQKCKSHIQLGNSKSLTTLLYSNTFQDRNSNEINDSQLRNIVPLSQSGMLDSGHSDNNLNVSESLHDIKDERCHNLDSSTRKLLSLDKMEKGAQKDTSYMKNIVAIVDSFFKYRDSGNFNVEKSLNVVENAMLSKPLNWKHNGCSTGISGMDNINTKLYKSQVHVTNCKDEPEHQFRNNLVYETACYATKKFIGNHNLKTLDATVSMKDKIDITGSNNSCDSSMHKPLAEGKKEICDVSCESNKLFKFSPSIKSHIKDNGKFDVDKRKKKSMPLQNDCKRSQDSFTSNFTQDGNLLRIKTTKNSDAVAQNQHSHLSSKDSLCAKTTEEDNLKQTAICISDQRNVNEVSMNFSKEAKSSSLTFKQVLFVGFRKHLQPYSDFNINKQMVYYDLSDIENGELRSLLNEIYIKKETDSLCCLVFDHFIISKKFRKQLRCTDHLCYHPFVFNTLRLKSQENAMEEIKEIVSCKFQLISKFIEKLSLHIPVIILPLVPARIYCHNETLLNHKECSVISDLDFHVVTGSPTLWNEAVKILYYSWNELMSSNNLQSFSYDPFSTYTAHNSEAFIIMDYVSSQMENWSGLVIWKNFIADYLSSAISLKMKQNGLKNSNSPHSLNKDDLTHTDFVDKAEFGTQDKKSDLDASHRQNSFSMPPHFCLRSGNESRSKLLDKGREPKSKYKSQRGQINFSDNSRLSELNSTTYSDWSTTHSFKYKKSFDQSSSINNVNSLTNNNSSESLRISKMPKYNLSVKCNEKSHLHLDGAIHTNIKQRPRSHKIYNIKAESKYVEGNTKRTNDLKRRSEDINRPEKDSKERALFSDGQCPEWKKFKPHVREFNTTSKHITCDYSNDPNSSNQLDLRNGLGLSGAEDSTVKNPLNHAIENNDKPEAENYDKSYELFALSYTDQFGKMNKKHMDMLWKEFLKKKLCIKWGESQIKEEQLRLTPENCQ